MDDATKPIPAAQLLRREGRPLSDPEPEPSAEDQPGQRRRVLGMAAGALLAAGTLAGALGLGNSGPVGEQANAAEPATSDMGLGTPADSSTADSGKPAKVKTKVKPAAQVKERTAPKPSKSGKESSDTAAAPSGTQDRVQQPTQPRQDAPTQPAPTPPKEKQPDSGSVGGVLTPVTDTVNDTVGGVTDTVNDTVGGVTDTVDDVLQPALTMIDPLGDLLGGRAS